MNKIRIAGAIASKTGITLYLENGKEMNLPNGSWRTQAILDEVLKPLARNKIVTLDLDDFSVERRIEKKTGGFIRFLRETVATIGEAIGLKKSNEPYVDPEQDWSVSNDNAEPAPQRLVAVVGNKRVPGVEVLEKQMERAAFGDNVVGFQKFMERIAAIIDDRGHTVDELLNFMQRGDLPIANDGSIIAYKVLNSINNDGGIFVDCHTGKVRQRLGSEVSMDAKLVDPSRRTQCSSGLHVARRGYLRNFGGNIITLIKIAPEDVIAVPFDEPDKMRVRAYHIVAVLPDEVHSILRSDKPMTTNVQASKILADAIAGNHIGIVERVVIGSSNGGDVRVNGIANAAPAPKPLQSGEAVALDGNTLTKSVREIKHEIEEAVAEKETAKDRRNRIKREKRAALKANKTAEIDASQHAEKIVSIEGRVLKDRNGEVGAHPSETAAERAARRKREKRAAAKIAQQDRVVSEPIKPAPSAPPAKREPAKSAFEKPKKKVKKSDVLDPKDRAVALVRDGMSKREAERLTGVSARTIGRLLGK